MTRESGSLWAGSAEASAAVNVARPHLVGGYVLRKPNVVTGTPILGRRPVTPPATGETSADRHLSRDPL